MIPGTSLPQTLPEDLHHSRGPTDAGHPSTTIPSSFGHGPWWKTEPGELGGRDRARMGPPAEFPCYATIVNKSATSPAPLAHIMWGNGEPRVTRWIRHLARHLLPHLCAQPDMPTSLVRHLPWILRVVLEADLFQGSLSHRIGASTGPWDGCQSSPGNMDTSGQRPVLRAGPPLETPEVK